MVPDVILMDIFLPMMNGIKATKHILKKWPHIKIIMLTSFITSELIQNSLKAGASGYFLKNSSGKSIIKGVRDAFEGKVTFSPEASKAMVDEIKDPLAKRFQLTRQEKNILNLMVEGLSNKDIAKRLYLSTSTVQFHITNILSKLGVTKRTEAVYLALKNNLVKFPIPDH
jgi:NarL family two-component system response regulator LiaR